MFSNANHLFRTPVDRLPSLTAGSIQLVRTFIWFLDINSPSPHIPIPPSSQIMPPQTPDPGGFDQTCALKFLFFRKGLSSIFFHHEPLHLAFQKLEPFVLNDLVDLDANI